MNDIKIRCSGCKLIPTKSLIPLQNSDLKILTKANHKKLQRNIETNGITFPLFVWKNQGNVFVIDGCQRLQIYNEFGIEKVPVIIVKAKDKEEADKYVLLANSQYAEITQDGFEKFIENLGAEILARLRFETNFRANIDFKVEPDKSKISYKVPLKYPPEQWEKFSKYLSFYRETWGTKKGYETDVNIILKCLRKTVELNEQQ